MGMVLVASAAAAGRSTRCSDHIRTQKGNGKRELSTEACSSRFGKFDTHIDIVHGLINEHISQSFLYSLMSSHFATDDVNRLGLIKFVGTRGTGMAPVADPTRSSVTGLRVANPNVVGMSEVEAFAWALDNHYTIAGQVHELHQKSRDAALIGFLEKQFTAKHAETIRELSGVLTNLVPMVQESAGRDMALYLFDQTYLG